jgi:hypothetical protein
MKTWCRTLAATGVAVLLGLVFVSTSTAQCGGVPNPNKGGAPQTGGSFHPRQVRYLQTAFVLAGDRDGHDAAIVGFWHFKFVSQGSAGIPDGTEVDAGYQQWHSDHTELTNSGGHSPLTSNFCTGVWKQTGERSYEMNHFAIAWDSTGANLIGPANIREQLTVSSEGNTFSGSFTVDQYDEAVNLLAHVQGTVTGTRITVDTPPESIF